MLSRAGDKTAHMHQQEMYLNAFCAKLFKKHFAAR